MNWKNNKNFQNFLLQCKKDLKKEGFTLYIGKGKLCNMMECSGYRSSAYFSLAQRKIAIASENPAFPRLIVHEMGHFYQWKNNYKWWIIANLVEKNIGDHVEWLFNGVEYSPSELDLIFTSIRNMEAECEQVALELIKKYDLPIDRSNYIKSANSYIYFYNLVKKVRKWYKEPPFNFKPILDLMPKHRIVQNTESLPKKYEQLCRKYCL